MREYCKFALSIFISAAVFAACTGSADRDVPGAEPHSSSRSLAACGELGRVTLMQTDGRIAVVVGGSTGANVCLFSLTAGIKPSQPRLPESLLVQSVGIVDTLLWVADGRARRLLLFDVRTGAQVADIAAPTLEPGLVPIIANVGAEQRVMIVHWPTDSENGTAFAVVTRLRDSVTLEVMDSLLVHTPVVRALGRGGDFSFSAPWVSADLAAGTQNGAMRLLQQASDPSLASLTELDPGGGRVIRRAEGPVPAASMLSRELIAGWVQEVATDSVVAVLGGGRRRAIAVLAAAVDSSVVVAPFSRLFVDTDGRMVLRKNWPRGDEWELRTREFRLVREFVVRRSVEVHAVAAGKMWGVTYDKGGHPSLVSIDLTR